ncbi:nuclear transport factor 2 family protein [Bradyrhizobium sp. Leo170]|uniref:nuclear transport factor 2 family protein n=1 Tax=Bradyrhizobium sp. Leo170 TaxID=1571199 RepID=UPI00102EC98C|nr:nuclear transport factor 2 family protein [Bradyrhizobium sp. Leo170]
MSDSMKIEQQKQAVSEVIAKYLTAVKTWDEKAFRETFHPKANIQHYYVKGDEIKTITLDEFVGSIDSLHTKYDNAEEKAREIEISIVDYLASVRVAFSFVMGPRTLDGQDLFNLAFCKGEWKIIHKSYYL